MPGLPITHDEYSRQTRTEQGRRCEASVGVQWIGRTTGSQRRFNEEIDASGFLSNLWEQAARLGIDVPVVLAGRLCQSRFLAAGRARCHKNADRHETCADQYDCDEHYQVYPSG